MLSKSNHINSSLKINVSFVTSILYNERSPRTRYKTIWNVTSCGGIIMREFQNEQRNSAENVF